MRVNPYYGGTLGAPVVENNQTESALDPLAAQVTREAPEPETESPEENNSNEWQSEKLEVAYQLIDHARELLTGAKFLAEVQEVDPAVIVLLCKAQQEFLRASNLIVEADTELENKLS